MAHVGDTGDLVILITYGEYSDAELRDFSPRVVQVDSRNRAKVEASVH
jgi:aspartate 1-decarboxylase